MRPNPVRPRPEAAPGAAAPPQAPGAASTQDTDASGSLVFFMNPISLEVPKGNTVRVTLFASGAQGLTSGTMELKVDPKLTVTGFAAGDFLTADGGSLTGVPGPNGSLVFTFQRKTGATDSGTFATLDVQATATGQAPILIQGGRVHGRLQPDPGALLQRPDHGELTQAVPK